MKIEIWKKRFMPEACPVCGRKYVSPEAAANQFGNTVDTFSKLLTEHFSGFYPKFVRKHEKWGIPCWYAYCANCVLIKELENRHSLFDSILTGQYKKPGIDIKFMLS